MTSTFSLLILIQMSIVSGTNFVCFRVMMRFTYQMFPMALVTGNTCLMKPSERDPGACMMLMEMANEAGFPEGAVNVIHGRHDGIYQGNFSHFSI